MIKSEEFLPAAAESIGVTIGPDSRGVTVYSAGPSCRQCTYTCLRLKASGIPFRVIELATNDAAREYVTEDLGYSRAPVVVVDDGPEHHWSGFDPIRIDRLAAAWGTR